VSDLAESLGANRAIPHRILAVLVELGYVAQDPMTERYYATFRLGALGLQQLESAEIEEWAQQPLDKLAADTQELARLAVASGGRLHWLAKAPGSKSSLMVAAVSGAEVVLHATASGKAWLSTWPEEALDRLLSEELIAPTDNTITDPDALREELQLVREQGFAIVVEEMEVGLSAVAVPIVLRSDEAGPAAGTVSVAGPSARLSRADLFGFTDDLSAAARAIASHWPVYRARSRGIRARV
jgi:DNA-binding IclR family transcriptional regulator